MNQTKPKAPLVGGIFLGIYFLISMINQLGSNLIKRIFLSANLNTSIIAALSLIAVLAVGGIAATLLLKKRSWLLPALLLVQPAIAIVGLASYFTIGRLLFKILLPILLSVYAFVLIYNPKPILKKLWFLPLILVGLTSITFFGFIYFLASVLYTAAFGLMFYWLAYPKGKRKAIKFKKAPVGAGCADDTFVPMVSHILLLIFTCGIYLYIWIYKTTLRVNSLSKESERNATTELLLCLFVPLYYIFWAYKTAQLIAKAGAGKLADDDFPTAVLLLSIFLYVGMPILVQERLNTLSRILQKEETAAKAAAPEQGFSANPDALMERTRVLLSAGQWQEAINLADACLNVAPQTGDAYLYKFLARYRVASLQAFGNLLYKIDSDPALGNVIAFANEERKQEISAVIEEINQNFIYLNAIEDFRTADTAKELDDAIAKFTTIIDFKDSRDYIAKCESAKEEMASGADCKKQVLKYAITGAAMVIIAIALIILMAISTAIRKANSYRNANELLASGDYEAAQSAFSSLYDYKDSQEKADECNRLNNLYDQLLSKAWSNLLEINMEDYKELNQELPHIKEINELIGKYGKYKNLTYDNNQPAELKVFYNDDSQEVQLKLEHGYSYYSNTSRRVGNVYTSMKEFTSKKISYSDAMNNLPITLQPQYSSSYYTSAAGPITIEKNQIQYTYTYNRVEYKVNFIVK